MYFPVFVCNISIYQQTCLNLVNVGRNHVSFRNSGQILEAVKTLKTFKKKINTSAYFTKLSKDQISLSKATQKNVLAETVNNICSLTQCN